MPFAVTAERPTKEQVRTSISQFSALAKDAVRRRPPVVTLALIVCIVTTFVRLEVGFQLPTGEFISGAFSGRALVESHYGVLTTSTLLTRDVFMVVSICISLLVTLGTYEVVAGHLRATVLAVVAAALGPVSVTAGLGILYALGNNWADGRLDTLDIGASAIVACSSGALAGIVRDRRLTGGLIVFLLGGLAIHHQLADWEHVLVFPWGYLAGRVFGRARIRPPRPSRRLDTTYAVALALLLAVSLTACAHVLPAPKTYRSPTGHVLSAPRAIDTSYPAPSMGGSRHVLILLPPGYDSSDHRYPVIELLHGDPGAAATMVAAANIQASQIAAGVAPFIGVAPDGNGPVVQRSWWVNTPQQAMGTAATVDLHKWVTSQFRVNGSWSYAGLSSGGFGAAYLAMISPYPVHAVCGLSGLYGGNIPPIPKSDVAAQNKVSPILHADRAPALTFLAYGAHNGTSSVPLPSYKDPALPYIAALHKAHKRVVVRTFPGGHSWGVWTSGYLACFRAVVPASGG